MENNTSTKINKILFVGDSVPNCRFTFSDRFVSVCQSHQLRVFNLEGSFSILQKPICKAGPHLLLEEKFLEGFVDCFNLAVIANNHAMDYGLEGLEATRYFCGRNNIEVVGAGANEDEAFSPFDRDGLRIIAVAENEFGAAGINAAGIASVENERQIFELIKNGKSHGKRVIVVVHGGSEVIPVPPPYVRERYKLWIEFGADLIIGNHPHVVQGHEIFKGKYIFYSLGNFAFENSSFMEYANSNWSLGVSFDVTKGTADIIPISVDDTNTIDIAGDYVINAEFNRLNSLLKDDDYMTVYNSICSKLYPIWYSRLMATSKIDAALLLHYFRCDAHRNMIVAALDQIVNDGNVTDLKNSRVIIAKNTLDSIIVENNFINSYRSKMQMLPEEIQYIEKILSINNKKYLEIGSGYSTLYFRKYVDEMVSVESRFDWFEKINKELKSCNAHNVNLICVPPEKCAYDNEGKEKCLTRITPSGNISDYGEKHEYITYLNRISDIIDEYNFETILVDGQVRKEIVQMLIEKKFEGSILLHDVIPEREYLNRCIKELEGLSSVSSVGSIVHFVVDNVDINKNPNKETMIMVEPESKKYDLIYESDWLASKPFFYNEVTGKFSHVICDVIALENSEIHPEGLINYLDFGYSVFEQTPIKNVKMLRHSSRFYHDGFGGYRIENLEDPVWSYLGKNTNEDDVWHLIESKVRNWESSVDGEIIIPTSGGYDSRLMNYFISDKSRIRSFTYGLSAVPEESFEVVIARRLSLLLKTKWEMIPLGEFNRYLDAWDNLYGISTHAHGMYHMEFYEKIVSKIGSSTKPLLSGIIGDVWAGVFIPEIKTPENLNVLGFTHGLRLDPSFSPLISDSQIRGEYWEANKELLQDPSFRVVEAMRRKLILLSYLYRVPQNCGFEPWSPFLDIDVALGMLNLPEGKRKNRLWQSEFFAKQGLDLESHGMKMDYSNVLDTVSVLRHPVPMLNIELTGKYIDSNVLSFINNMLGTVTTSNSIDYRELLKAYYAYVIVSPIDKHVTRACTKN